MGFKVGQIVKNIYPIEHQIISPTYTVSNKSKLKNHTNSIFEPDDWNNYEKLVIEPGSLFEILQTREIPCDSRERYACMGLPHPNDRLIVRMLKPHEKLDRDWLEQPALLFRPTAAGEVLYGRQDEDSET